MYGCSLQTRQGLAWTLLTIQTIKMNEDMAVKNAWGKCRATDQQGQVGWTSVGRLPGGGKLTVSLGFKRIGKRLNNQGGPKYYNRGLGVWGGNEAASDRTNKYLAQKKSLNTLSTPTHVTDCILEYETTGYLKQSQSNTLFISIVSFRSDTFACYFHLVTHPFNEQVKIMPLLCTQPLIQNSLLPWKAVQPASQRRVTER